MNCPKCGGEMEKVDFHSIEIDRCRECRGIWFDQWEEKRLKSIPDSAQLDIGDPAVGTRFDRLANVNCPVCKIPMNRIEDISQESLWYESCPQCLGVYFDAGEFKQFRDFQPESLVAFIKRVLLGKK